MEIVKILGVDPSLRNTGMAIVHYNTELPATDPAAFKVTNCQVLTNNRKYTGNDAILNMIDMINHESSKECYIEVDNVMVESPPTMFNKKLPASIVANLAHISGAAVALLGLEKAYLFKPSEWNSRRKKDVTHAQTQAFLGNLDTWHFEKMPKNEAEHEHILDAASFALWWIKTNYITE